jgi:hypothetical protein
MATFYLRPSIYCAECGLCLFYTLVGGKELLRHTDLGGEHKCSQSGRSFKIPTIELEPCQPS